jgi:hypothetical protein
MTLAVCQNFLFVAQLLFLIVRHMYAKSAFCFSRLAQPMRHNYQSV